LLNRPFTTAAVCLLGILSSCSWGLFSGVPTVDRSRPVALIETTGGVEYGATTEFGILMLGRTAMQGACRVHYFLGAVPIIEDGKVIPTGSAFYAADIDLQTQQVRVLDHAPNQGDELLAMWLPDGTSTRSVPVTLASAEGVTGDVIDDPGEDLPPGAAIFAKVNNDLRFVGLISGKATLQEPGTVRGYYTFAGIDRVRELLAVPTLWPPDFEPHFRPDSIHVLKPITEKR
jgi:hypothetical protein